MNSKCQISCEYIAEDNQSQISTTKEQKINQKSINLNNEKMIFSNINKEKGQIKFDIKINNENIPDNSYIMNLSETNNLSKTTKGEYIIKFNNNYEIAFLMKIENAENSEKKIIPKNSIRDRINFFSNKGKEKENQTSKTSNNNKIRNSCVLNNPFLEKINQNISNQKRKEQNQNISNKKNNEKEVNKAINKVSIKPKTGNNNREFTRSYTIIPDYSYKNTEEFNRTQTNTFLETTNNEDLNRTQSIYVPKGGKISNFIKDKLSFITNRNKNKHNTVISNKNTNINNNNINNNNKKEINIATQNKGKNEPNAESKNYNEIQAKSSKQLGKILTKSTSSTNLKINNNLKNKLPNLSSKDVDQFKIIDDTQSTSISSNRSSVTELVLDSINYDAFLEQQNKKDTTIIKEKEKERETFCEGFFIASFPKQNGKVIENSFSFRPPCGHFKCSKLPAMKPEIIMRYPLEDTKNLDINNLAASICFPTGIKVCYFENNPTIMKDYVTPITNQKGERYYMMTYHFFLKMTNSEFTKVYEENPLKHHLKRFGEAYVNLRGEELTEKIVNEIQETLHFCEELGFRDYVYIPHCICLISRYPYVNEMEKCLQSIYYLMLAQTNDSKLELNNLIMFLIHSIPIPLNRNSKLKFNIPYFNNGIEIACPKLNDINIININVSILLKLFSIENIVIILRLLLFEKKLLFIDDNYERLSNVIDIFISLIYPFKWIHTYIPIMSEEMINYIETFLPFVNGLHKSLLNMVKKLIKENDTETESSSNSTMDDDDNEVFFLIYITDNKIGLSSEFKNKFKDVNTYIKENIPALPQNMEKGLFRKLKNIKKEIDLYSNLNNNNTKINNNKNKIQELNSKFDFRLRNTFIELFVEILSGFYKYLAILDNNDVVFNKKLFMKEKPFHDLKFYDEFIDTQIFQQFIQTVIVNDNYNYFKTMLIHNSSYTKYLSVNPNNKVDSYLYSIPDIFDNSNNDINNIRKILKEDCYLNYTKISENGILLNNQRILPSIKYIDQKNYNNKNCSIYLLPQFKNNNINNDKDMEKLNINFLKKFENYKPEIDTINENEEIFENTPKIKLNINKNQNILNEKEIDNLEEYIKDFTIKLFSSKKLDIYSNKTKTEIQNAISSDYGRKYFVNLLLKNISHNNIVILEYSYFNFLGNLIYNLILSTLKIEETDEVLEQIIYLIKCTNFYGKKEYDKHGMHLVTLWDIYKPKIQTNPKVVQINFWNKWYEIEYENSLDKSDNEIQIIIYRICDLMICLELPKSFIKNVLNGIANRIFGKDSTKSKETFSVFIKKIVNAKYISQVLL